MALFHSHASVFSRSSGCSSVAKAAYRSGTQLVDERSGVVHDYSRKSGVVHSEVVLPDGAPARWLDRSTLWNGVERHERGGNAQVAREIEYALPRELDAREQVGFARAYARSFAREGMVADFSIHDGRGINPHVHMLLTMSPCDGQGFTARTVNEYLVRDVDGNERRMTADELRASGGGWAKVFRYKNGEQLTQTEAEDAGLHPTRDRRSKTPVQSKRYVNDWNTPEKVIEWRERLASMQNLVLEAKGSDERVSHLSYDDRGIERVPTLHEGPIVTQMERRAEERAVREGRKHEPVTEARRLNMAIRRLNERLEAVMEKVKRSFMEWRRSLNHVDRGRSANSQRRVNRSSRKGHRAQHGHGGMTK